MIEAKRTHRRWLRFSLQTLFVFVVLSSVVAAPFLYRANKQRLTVARLEKLGAQVGYDLDLRDFPLGPPSSFAPPFGPQWLYTFMGVDYFRTANFLGFEGDKVKDEDLKLLNDLPDLVFLSLGECSSVTGGALYQLSNTPHLAVIVLGPQNSSDDALKSLERFPKLEFLYINAGSNVEISDAGLEKLAKLKSLRLLGLEGDYFTDATLRHLEGLIGLKELIFEGTRVTDLGINVLKAKLSNCKISKLHFRVSE